MSEPKKRVREEDEEEAGEPQPTEVAGTQDEGLEPVDYANLSADEVERLFPKQQLVDALAGVLSEFPCFVVIGMEESDLAKDPISAEGSAD